MSLVEREYEAQIAAMTVAEKMEQSMAMLRWAREMIARQIRAENPAIGDERLRWEVAYRQYDGEPRMTQDIDWVVDNAAAADRIDGLIESFSHSDFLFDETAVRRGVQNQRMFWLLDTRASLKLNIDPR